MILTDIEIMDMVKNYSKYSLKAPLIESFEDKRLQSSSYDITISNKITIFEKYTGAIDIRDQNLIDSIYKEIDISNGYTLNPNEYILVYINERINLPNNIIANIRPRTRFTRLGLLLSPQHCNQTYSGNLKLGLYNATPYDITIYPNIGIGQIVFEELKSIPSENKWYKNLSKSQYNNERDFIGAKISKELESEVNKFYDQLITKLNNKINKNDNSDNLEV